MEVTTTKSKNSESFYITMSYVNNEGKSTSKTIRKLGTLKELSQQLATDRDGVLAWAKEQARVETEKYKKQNQAKTVLIPFHADRLLDYHQQKLFKGGCPENCQRQDYTTYCINGNIYRIIKESPVYQILMCYDAKA